VPFDGLQMRFIFIKTVLESYDGGCCIVLTTVYVQLRVVSKRVVVDRMIRDVFLEVRGVQYE